MNCDVAACQQLLKLQLAYTCKFAGLPEGELVLLEEQECDLPPQFSSGHVGGTQDIIRDHQAHMYASPYLKSLVFNYTIKKSMQHIYFSLKGYLCFYSPHLDFRKALRSDYSSALFLKKEAVITASPSSLSMRT